MRIGPGLGGDSGVGVDNVGCRATTETKLGNNLMCSVVLLCWNLGTLWACAFCLLAATRHLKAPRQSAPSLTCVPNKVIYCWCW